MNKCISIAFIGDSCLSPEVKAETYTTTEAIVSTETVFIVQFTLTCKNKVRVSTYIYGWAQSLLIL